MSWPYEQPLPWHEVPWAQLRRARETSRLPHALLLHGPQGLGKGIFARRLGGALLCHQSDAHGDACGHCQGCRLFRAGNHPDTLWIQPESPGKPIKVDRIRQLNAFVVRTTEFGGARVMCLEPAEQMNVNAANSLLKTLEEPTPGSLLILVSTHPARLPATVRSRCQQLAFQRPNIATARAWLDQQLDDGVDASLLLQLARGAPLAALGLADARQLQRRQQLFEDFVAFLQGRGNPLDQATGWLEDDPAGNLGWLLDWHMDLIRLKMSPEPAGLSNLDLRPGLLELARELSPGTLFSQLEAVSRLHALASTSASMPLQLEAFLMAYPRITRRRAGGR